MKDINKIHDVSATDFQFEGQLYQYHEISQYQFNEMSQLKDNMLSKFCMMTSSSGNWKYFPRYWPFVWGIYRSRVNSPHNGQWCGALMFYLFCAGTNSWANKGKAGDLRCLRAHYDVTVMGISLPNFTQMHTHTHAHPQTRAHAQLMQSMSNDQKVPNLVYIHPRDMVFLTIL